MSQWQTFGHEDVKNLLNKQFVSGRFSHAYLFVGPLGLGKKSLALEFAKKILNVENLNNHPDFVLLDQTGEIKIEQVKEFMERLPLQPFVAEKKVAIINHAQNLNTQAGNALLKTLEEPSLSTIIILIAEGKSGLPTIVSRCQVLNFNPLSHKRLNEFAEFSNIQAGPEEMALSFGSPGRLMALARDKELLNREKSLVSALKKISNAATAERFLAVSEFGNKESLELESIFSTWLMWEAGNNPQPKKLSSLMNALAAIRKNFNKKLILQNLFLNL